MDIYDLTWTDEYNITYAVCPDCHGTLVLDLGYKITDDKQEWACEECWHYYDETGRNLGKIDRTGWGPLKCPECGDFRIAHDDDGCCYCHNCKTAYRKYAIETWYDDENNMTMGRLVDFGPPEHPKTCPNCGDPLRRKIIETIGGNYWAYPCKVCGVQYRCDGTALVLPKLCPKCKKFGVGHSKKIHVDRTVKPAVTVDTWYQSCRFCKTEFDMDGNYLNPADVPTHGNRQIPKSVIGFVSGNSNSVKPQ